MMDSHIAKVLNEFQGRFGAGGALLAVRAPGRVNLIGEHTDYNDGFVLPVGMAHAVYMAGRPAAGRASRVYSMNFNEERTLNLDAPFIPSKPDWSTYIDGVARALEQMIGRALRGVDAVMWGNVPLGSGLSSSAALEVAAGYFLLQASDIDLPLPDLARACRQAENEFVGVQCGIMDQFASCLADTDRAIFLDCRSLAFEYVPAPFEQHTLLVLNTNVPRTLAGSAYNDRRRACERGVDILKKHLPGIRALRDVSFEQFSALESELPGDVAAKCRHVVTENHRVLQSVDALRNNDMARFGEFMNASHRSLRDDYAVSCRELDLLHDAATAMPGVAGERMTGAGFGGCAVALVRTENADLVQADLQALYLRETGLALDVYRTTAMPGVRRMDI